MVALTEAAGAGDLAAIKTLATLIKDIAEGDCKFDTGQTPWQLVVFKKGDAGTEYFRKDCFQPDGSDVTSLVHIIGQLKDPV